MDKSIATDPGVLLVRHDTEDMAYQGYPTALINRPRAKWEHPEAGYQHQEQGSTCQFEQDLYNSSTNFYTFPDGSVQKTQNPPPCYSNGSFSSTNVSSNTSPIFDSLNSPMTQRFNSTSTASSRYPTGSCSSVSNMENASSYGMAAIDEDSRKRTFLTIDTHFPKTLSEDSDTSGGGVSIINGMSTLLLESPESIRSPNSGVSAANVYGHDDVQYTTDPCIRNMNEAPSNVCPCHGWPCFPNPTPSLPLGFGCGPNSRHLWYKTPSASLIRIAQNAERMNDQVCSALIVPTTRGGVSHQFAPFHFVLKDVLNALRIIDSRSGPGLTGQQVLSILIMAYNIIEALTEGEVKQASLQPFFIDSFAWFAAINHEGERIAASMFLIIAWPDIFSISRYWSYGKLWTCLLNSYCPETTIVSSMTRSSLAQLSNSVPFRACVEYFRTLDTFDFQRRMYANHVPLPTTINQKPGPSFLGIVNDCLRSLNHLQFMDEFSNPMYEVSELIKNGSCPTLYALRDLLCEKARSLTVSDVPVIAYTPFCHAVDEAVAIARTKNGQVFDAGALIEWAARVWGSETRGNTKGSSGAGKLMAPVDSLATFEENSAIPVTPDSNSGQPLAIIDEKPKLRLQPRQQVLSAKHSPNLARQPRARKPRHSDSEPGGPRTVCEKCLATFEGRDRNSNMKKHRDSVHANNEFRCQWNGCIGHCNRRDNLIKHVREKHIHMENGRVSCSWGSCRAPFSDTKALVKHLYGHVPPKHRRGSY
ncbi:MAG: hypothetical protein Q9160_006423 [Pyrenula sp. 1 TL-2023]